MTFEELKLMLPVSKHSLDEDAEKHPILFQEVCERLANASKMLTDKKSQLNEAIEKSYSEFRVSKNIATGKTYTVEDCKRMAEASPKVVKLKVACSVLQGRVMKWEALKESYKQRGYTIRLLADLWLGNYWSNSSVKPRKDSKQNDSDTTYRHDYKQKRTRQKRTE